MLFQDLCGSPPCASSTAWRTSASDAHCVSTKSKWRRSSLWFSIEAMAKGYQAYRDSWSTVLNKKCLARGKLANRSIFHWHEDSAEKCAPQRHGQWPRPAYANIHTANFFSKANTAFLQNIAPPKFPAIWYGKFKIWVWVMRRLKTWEVNWMRSALVMSWNSTNQNHMCTCSKVTSLTLAIATANVMTAWITSLKFLGNTRGDHSNTCCT